MVGIDFLQILSRLINGKLSWKILLIHSPHLFSRESLIHPFPRNSDGPGLAVFLRMPLPRSFYAKVLHRSVESWKWYHLQRLRVLSSYPSCPSPFYFPVQNSWVSPVPVFWIIRKKRGDHFEWSVSVERRKCNCGFYWPSSKCHCLVFLFFKN